MDGRESGREVGNGLGHDVFGIIGKKKVEQSGGALQGRGLALAGAICGAVAIGLFLIWLLLLIVGAFNSDSSSY